jgi:hypothetical protein
MLNPKMTAAAVAMAGIVLLGGSWSAADDRLDITGQYQGEGDNARGGKYTATVTIAKRQATYVVKWEMPAQEQFGVGILEGDLLSVSWVTEGGAGIVVYKIRNNGDTLVGRWAQVGGDGQTFSEILTRKADQGKSPPMARTGRPPDGRVAVLR